MSGGHPEGACRVVTVARRLTAVIRARVPLSDIRDAQRGLRARIATALPEAGVGNVGASLTLWRPPVDGILDMEPGYLVSRECAPVDDLVASYLPAGTAAHLRLIGSYEQLPGAWQTLFDWCAAQKLTLAGVNWEIYANPSEDLTEQETLLYALLRSEGQDGERGDDDVMSSARMRP